MGLLFEIIELTYLELIMEPCSTFHLQVIMTNFDDPGTLSVPEFGIALGLYTEEFMDDNELGTLHRDIHYSSSKCWKDLVPASAAYDPSRSKYRLVQSTEEEDPEDITVNVPLRHEDPSSQPPPIHRPVHTVASYSDISERLTRFEQQCFQHFDHIDASLHQIFQYLHISSPPPPHELSGDDDV
ncbi:hypothetical protein GOBAR_AA04962 [Gossypium barbadense]|uniref:Uncharacterized protein n=1 Tax=Gossypium barbadense TaxID=3634 RepID=A0A2P5YJ68_GOSBA|nr:hypothetical protein GOBAR_AA04962 [Gossypium barbadense]